MPTEQSPFKYIPLNTFFMSDEVGPYTFQKISEHSASVVTVGRPTSGPLVFKVDPDTLVTVTETQEAPR